MKAYRYITYFFSIAMTFIAISAHGKDKQRMNVKDYLSLSVDCVGNPECKDTNKHDIQFIAKIRNNSPYNLEIPLTWIEEISFVVRFTNLKTGDSDGSLPGMPTPQFLKSLILIKPNEEIILMNDTDRPSIRKVLHKKKANLLMDTYFLTYIHYQGSKEPIGEYKNGKLEPILFHFGVKKIIQE